MSESSARPVLVRDRNSLRAIALKSRAPKKKQFTFFDVEIELRQPKLGDIISAQNAEDREAAIIDTLIKYAYIPGTDERLFEEGDAETLKGQPFGRDFLEASQAFEELTDVNFLNKKATSDNTQKSS